MFQETIPLQEADVAVTGLIALKNSGVALLVAFVILYATAYKRVGSDSFVFVDWFVANRNRWINGVITLILFSLVAFLIPDLSAASNAIGFNLNAPVPLSFGVALAAWLASTTKAAEPKVADQGDPRDDEGD